MQCRCMEMLHFVIIIIVIFMIYATHRKVSNLIPHFRVMTTRQWLLTTLSDLSLSLCSCVSNRGNKRRTYMDPSFMVLADSNVASVFITV